ncbi:unnamed protein product [Chondrus crispus]|uniref:BTB domain-containing protein n=1 Tax=Chondrus crispus TaxID=2769 RepID=R7QLU1_CHOCR|nr:unnamed protein product [Chondrus crispus]CDF39049.1 unnamed protein product [Chondrus crispus]|eukprot:XP_005718960.1 unnamed protein product [Chondrus crispus]
MSCPSLPPWEADTLTLRPSRAYLDLFCSHYRAIDTADPLLHFRFTPSAPEQPVHHSRLLFVGGPLAALATRDFREKNSAVVTLSPLDAPDVFALIRRFLYAAPLPLEDVAVDRLLRLARATHRWQLTPLFEALCTFVAEQGFLDDPQNVLQAADLSTLPDVPPLFVTTFWTAAAKAFDDFGPQPLPKRGRCRLALEDSDDEDAASSSEQNPGTSAKSADIPPILARLCPRFPHIWDIALSQQILPSFLLSVSSFSKRDLTIDLLDLLVQYIEPRLASDDVLVRLFSALDPGAVSAERLFERPSLVSECSPRAMRLLAKSILSASHLKHEMSFSWEIPSMVSGMVRKTFFFGACSYAGKDNAFSALSARVHIEEDKGLYSTESCVLFNLDALVTGGSPSMFHLQWDVGHAFPLKDKDMDLRVAIIDSDCSCPCYRARGGKEVQLAKGLYEPNLYEWKRSEKVERSNKISVVLPKDSFEALRERHNYSTSNPLTIWLHVRLR